MAKYNRVTVLLNNVTLSFANLFKPTSFNGSAEAYSANILLSKDDKEQVKKVEEAIEQLIKMQWPVNAPAFKADKIAFKDGDNVTYSGYENHHYIVTKNSRKPHLKDLDLSDIEENDNKLLSGDEVNVHIDFWAQDSNFGKRINCSIQGVQFVKAGERFKPANGNVFNKLAEVKKEVQKQDEDEEGFDPFLSQEPKKLKFSSNKE